MKAFFCCLMLVLLAACDEAPPAFALVELSPSRIASALGETITVEGEGLERLSKAWLRQGAREMPLQVLSSSPKSARLAVEPGLAAGRWDLVLLSDDGQRSEKRGGLESFTGELQIEVVNVGQGSGGFIRAPDGTTLVIDGGRARTRGGSDSIAPVLTRRSITRPDFILVTHFDADHLGGIVDFMRGEDELPCTEDDRVPRLGLFDYAEGLNTCATGLCIEYYAMRDCNASKMASGFGWKVPAAGTRLRLGPGTDVTFVALNGVVSDGRSVPTGSDNSNSIALLVEFGPFRFFTGGDLTGGPSEGCLVGSDTADVESAVGEVVGPVDVLHVNHHGSCTSSNPSFVASLQPTVSLVSVGRDNAYGHPHQTVVDRLADAGSMLFLTEPGMTGSDERFAKTVLPESAEKRTGHLQISSEDGASYTVEVLNAEGVPIARHDFTSLAAP